MDVKTRHQPRLRSRPRSCSSAAVKSSSVPPQPKKRGVSSRLLGLQQQRREEQAPVEFLTVSEEWTAYLGTIDELARLKKGPQPRPSHAEDIRTSSQVYQGWCCGTLFTIGPHLQMPR